MTKPLSFEEARFQFRLKNLVRDLLEDNRNAEAIFDSGGYLVGVYDSNGKPIQHKPDRPRFDETKGKILQFKR